MKIKNAQLAATLAIVGFIAWALTARLDTARSEAPEENNAPSPAAAIAKVETRISHLRDYARQSVLQGQVEPWRSVELRARVAGTVESLLAEQGARVKQNQPLVALSHHEYQAQLSSARAAMRLKEAELKGAEKLYKNNLQTETGVLRLQSELEAARSNVVLARQQLDYAQQTAPFDGMLDQLNIELGQYISPGENLGRIVDVSRLKVTAQVPQQDAMHIAVGQPVEVVLLDGRKLTGQVHFIASAADRATRSFPLEVSVDNPDGLRIAGASATLNVDLGIMPAHKISPALLSLNETGSLGVKWVNEQHNIVFQPVELLSTQADGAWISGLPDQVPVVTLGGGFVAHGQKVDVVSSDTASDASNRAD